MKIAVIKKHQRSAWRSCQSITSNLEEAYLNLSGSECSVFGITPDESHHELIHLADEVIENGFEAIAWIDHYPHPGNFFKVLIERHKEKLIANPLTVNFHLFGDFILHSPMWASVEETLKNFNGLKTNFICASHKQAELVSALFPNYECPVIPFPVRNSEFNYKSEKRTKKREELSLSQEELVFFYSGRLSYQKNVLDAIQSFALFKKLNPSPSKFIIAGKMDDLGIPYLGKLALQGTFYFHWEECLRLLPSEVRKDILFVGNLQPEELEDYYQAADYYLSLSCHNDEDYGMAPAEALMCGLPCFLTAWGGFSSFQKYLPEAVTLCPLEIDSTRQGPEKIKVAKQMLLLERRNDREQIANNARASLSIEAVSKNIESLLTQPTTVFTGFNDNFHKLRALFATKAPFRSPSGGYSLFYKELYSKYCGEVK